jgi:hypothetical protein
MSHCREDSARVRGERAPCSRRRRAACTTGVHSRLSSTASTPAHPALRTRSTICLHDRAAGSTRCEWPTQRRVLLTPTPRPSSGTSHYEIPHTRSSSTVRRTRPGYRHFDIATACIISHDAPLVGRPLRVGAGSVRAIRYAGGCVQRAVMTAVDTEKENAVAPADAKSPLEEAEVLLEQLSLQDAFKRFQERRKVRPSPHNKTGAHLYHLADS